jgi:hypothetical protein
MLNSSISVPLAELGVEAKLQLRDVVEPAEIDVVRSGVEGAAHHRRVQAVVGAVHADRAPVEHLGDGTRVRGVDLLLSGQPRVATDERCAPPLKEARDVAPDRSGCTDHRDHGWRRLRKFQ